MSARPQARSLASALAAAASVVALLCVAAPSVRAAPERRAPRVSARRLHTITHAIVGFEHARLSRSGKLTRRWATKGLAKDTTADQAAQMLAAIYGAGSIELGKRDARGTAVVWVGENGRTRRLGLLSKLGKSEIFKISSSAKRKRNAVIGEALLAQLDTLRRDRTYGDWSHYIDSDRTGARDGYSRTTYQEKRRLGRYGGVEKVDAQLLSKAVAKLEGGNLGLLADALAPSQTAGGGLSIGWTSKGAGNTLQRHRVVFRPKGTPKRSTFDQVVGLLMGGASSGGGGATHHAETFERGKPRQRSFTRREQRQARGWLKDQLKRFEQLAKTRSPVRAWETEVARRVWHVGARDFVSQKPAPLISDKNPPNLMFAALYGRGRIAFGDASAQGSRAVYWQPQSGARVEIGALETGGKRPRFRLSTRMQQDRDRYLGETILNTILSTKSRRKGYGYDANDAFHRFGSTDSKRSDERVGVETTRVERTKISYSYGRSSAHSYSETVSDVPRRYSSTIVENSGHVHDSLSQLWPKPLDGVVRGLSGKRKKISMTWRASHVFISSNSGGKSVALPAGKEAVYKLTLRDAWGPKQVIDYSYEIVDAAH